MTSTRFATWAPDVYVERLVVVLAEMGDRPCLKHDGRGMRACDLLSCIHRYARALDALGIGCGDVVAIFAPNCPDALAVRYAANLVGAGATFLSEAGTPAIRAQLVGTLAPKLLVVFAQTASLAPSGITVPIAGIGLKPAGGFDLAAAAACQPDSRFECRARPDDLAVIVSSGGSTGVPKGSWRSFATYSAMVSVPSAPDRRQLINGPLAYLSQVLVDMTLLGGGTVVFRDRYEAVDTMAVIEAERITDLFLVEPQLFDLMDHPRLPSADLTSLRTLTHIGASAPAVLRRRAHARLGPRIVHTYGASEEGLVSVLTAAENEPAYPDRLHCAGRILPSVQVRFRRENGTLAATGEAGSIEIRSPAMAQGYRNRPELEASAFRDGWYRSGDLGRLDAHGYLHVFGRAVDIAFVGNCMVSPTLIEDTLCNLPQVRYACVVVDAEASQRIALVLPHDGAAITQADCLAAVSAEYGEEVANSMRLLVRRSVPLTPQGKPDREAIRLLGRAATALA